METLMQIVKSDVFLLVISAIIIIMFFAYIVLLAKYSGLNKKYKNFMKKLGNGKNVEEYSAFKDTGSDLSFTLALLDENNDGVVLNGIYSREMSNIYAKPVKDGKSTYTISEEENQAIQKAIGSDGIFKVN